MKNSLYFKGLRLWVEGLLLLALRWAQLKSGFDPETGLSLRSVPGLVLAAALILLIVAEAAQKKERMRLWESRSWCRCF